MASGKSGGWGYILWLTVVLASIILAFVDLYFLLTLQQVLLATLVLLAAGIAGWRGFYHLLEDILGYSEWTAFGAAIGGLIGSFVLYMGMLLIAPMAGVVVDLYGVAPPMLLILEAAAFGFYAIHLGIVNTLGIRGTTMGRLFVGLPIFLVFSYSFVFGVALGGDWANAGEMLGESGFAITSTASDVYEASSDAVTGVWNSLQPSQNRGTARLACSWEMFAGGSLYGAASGGGGAIEQCVNQKVGQNQTQTPSEEVSDPVTVRIEESWAEQIEPFIDHMRVEVPVTNTLVTDVQGRPINIMAENVNLSLEWYYLNRRVAHVWKNDAIPGNDEPDWIEIPNGDTRNFVFERDENGDFYFPIYSIQSQMTDNDIRVMLGTIKAACYQDKDSYPGKENDCAWAQNVTLEMLLEFDGSTPEVETDEDGNERVVRKSRPDVSLGRIAFLVKHAEADPTEGASTLSREHLDASGHDGFATVDGEQVDLAYLIEQEFGDELRVLAPNKPYRITATVQYDYSAEAAFTDSSRWSSTNNLLELWQQSAWQDQSFSERQNWERQKCKGVTRFGQEIDKQRTAALTTPIVPVMYADCGGSLFRLFTEDHPDDADNIVDGKFNISIGATVNRNEQINQEKGFDITRAVTDCHGITSMEEATYWRFGQQDEKGTKIGMDATIDAEGDDISDALLGDDGLYEPRYREGPGWIINPGLLQVRVNVPGERRSIGCRVNMEFTVNLGTETTYETPSVSDLG